MPTACEKQFEQHPIQLDMIIQVNICSEGYDHPPVNVVTFFKTVRSPLHFIQAMGRATRRYGTQQYAHVVADDVEEVFRPLWQRLKAHVDDANLLPESEENEKDVLSPFEEGVEGD